ncbi:hypothetical protein ABZX90_17025 [Streptomyces sp. NPDC002935]|uniref:WD40 repeat domain-containing protein n=1 Tax=unclassified Streptomyces TaxID=2593676 RepID=UPI00331A5108
MQTSSRLLLKALNALGGPETIEPADTRSRYTLLAALAAQPPQRHADAATWRGSRTHTPETSVRHRYRATSAVSLMTGLVVGVSAGYWTGWANKPATPYGAQPATANVQQVIDVGSAATGATFGPSETLAIGTARGSVTVLDVRHPKEKVELGNTSAGPVTRTVFSPEGSVLAVGSDDGTVRLWRSPMNSPQRPAATLPMREDGQYGGAVNDLAYSPDGRFLAVASSTSTVRIWDVSKPERPVALAAPSREHAVTRLAFNPVGNVLAVGSTDGTVQLWDMENPAKPRTIEGSQLATGASVTALAFSANRESLAIGTSRGSVQLWNVSQPANPHRVDSARAVGYTNDLSFNTPGYVLAASNSDGTVRVWDELSDLMNPRVLTRETNQGELSSVTFANGNDNTLAVTGTDGFVQLWTA